MTYPNRKFTKIVRIGAVAHFLLTHIARSAVREHREDRGGYVWRGIQSQSPRYEQADRAEKDPVGTRGGRRAFDSDPGDSAAQRAAARECRQV